MNANPFLGVFFHWLGGLAAGSFYVPYRGVRRWSWETYWLVGGFFSWIIAPWLVGYLMTSDLLAVLREAPWESEFWPYFWGVMWGLGGLTFGLTMRYLGMSLGMAVALGYCAAFGTLAPPIYHGEFAEKLLGTVLRLGDPGRRGRLPGRHCRYRAGRHVERAGNARGAEKRRHQGVQLQEGPAGGHVLRHPERVVLLRTGPRAGHQVHHAATRRGGRLAGRPPMAPQCVVPPTPRADVTAARVQEALKDPDLKKSLAETDDSIKKAKNDSDLRRALSDYKEECLDILRWGGDLKRYLERYTLWQGLPVLVVVLLGGFTTNFIWCVLLNLKNKTGHQYFSPTVRDHPPGRQQETIIETAIDAPSEEVVEHIPRPKPEPASVPMFWNYVFCALAGTTWYLQFFFYSMGETQMGKYKFSSWTLHMASIIIFSTLWGIALREWKGIEPADDRAGDHRAGRADPLHHHRRLRQLPCDPVSRPNEYGPR